MYEQFFGLRDQPFRLTPDPRYLYLGSKHREAYAHLLYALREGSGFVAIMGEVGTGKTTLVRAMLAENRDEVAVAYIFNPVLSSIELLQTINAEFGVEARTTSKKELFDALGAFLLAQKSAGGRAVIIIDEAQNLDPAVLEQLRLLSNLETETAKLLQIVLLGQPELRNLLDRPELRQLSQRVALRWELDPLSPRETGNYVAHRVGVAGHERQLFNPGSTDTLYEHTGGIPRLINILAHRSLLVAYSQGASTVGPAEVSMAAAELEQGKVPLRTTNHRGGGWAYKAAAGVAVAVAAGVVAFLLVAPLGESSRGGAVDMASRKAQAKNDPRVDRSDRKANILAANADAADHDVRDENPADIGTRTERADATGAKSRATKTGAKTRADAKTGTKARVAKTEPRSGAAKAASGQRFVKTAKADTAVTVTKVNAAAADDPAVARFVQRLERSSPYETASGSMSRLIELWTGAPLAPTEIASGTLDLQLLGARRGLRYLAAEMSPQLLQLIDLPAVIELELPGGGDMRYVLLEQLGPDSARVRLDRPTSVSRATVEAYWTGRAHLLWRDSERLSRALIPGAEGPAVSKLQLLLTEAGTFDGPVNGLYNDDTQAAVRKFQADNGLVENGVAGIVTQIVLYNRLARFERPSLAENKRDAKARRGAS